MGEKKWLTTGQLAERLGVPRVTVWRWIKEGRIAARRTLGGHYLISEDEAERVYKEMWGE